jgi:RNA polymerase sigma factor (sigma-70 family)
MPTDAELLQRYAGQKDERAFAELVQRHLGLVYATALRTTGGRRHLAEEIVQKVFTDVARKSAALCHHPVLTGWLYRSTRYAAMEANRTEARRQKLNQNYAAMSDNADSAEPSTDWEQLQPVIDGAMEELRAADRELVLLRFFQGLTFPEIASRLELSENAARMRTERALDKLRDQLGKRGVTSTGSALGMVLANQALASAPAGMATAVTASALASAPATGGPLAFLLMNKTIAPALGALLAAGATTLVWTALFPGITAAEVSELRAENSRLTQEAAITVTEESVADESARQTIAIIGKLSEKIADRSSAGAGQHRNRGQATAKDAFLSYAWAIDAGDQAALMRLITYEEKGREAIRTLHAGMPAAVREKYRTPEELIAFLYVADALLNPVPGADVAEGFVATEIRPGVAAVHRPDGSRGAMKFIQTTEGWKCVVPDAYPAHMAGRVLSNEMLGRLGLN